MLWGRQAGEKLQAGPPHPSHLALGARLTCSLRNRGDAFTRRVPAFWAGGEPSQRLDQSIPCMAEHVRESVSVILLGVGGRHQSGSVRAVIMPAISVVTSQDEQTGEVMVKELGEPLGQVLAGR